MNAHEMIKEMIDTFGLSVVYISDKTNVNRSTVYRWYILDINRMFDDNAKAIKSLYKTEKQKAKRKELI